MGFRAMRASSTRDREARMTNALSEEERVLIDRYWRAANYLSVGQIYLYDNPLLKGPLTKDHIKPRLLGHWGTTPGLNFIYVHLNRVIKKHDLDMIYITGRSEEHTSELQSLRQLVCRLLLEKKKQ